MLHYDSSNCGSVKRGIQIIKAEYITSRLMERFQDFKEECEGADILDDADLPEYLIETIATALEELA